MLPAWALTISIKFAPDDTALGTAIGLKLSGKGNIEHKKWLRI
jgi:hypothetical protein